MAKLYKYNEYYCIIFHIIDWLIFLKFQAVHHWIGRSVFFLRYYVYVANHWIVNTLTNNFFQYFYSIQQKSR